MRACLLSAASRAIVPISPFTRRLAFGNKYQPKMELSLIDRISFSGNTLNPKEQATLSVVIAKKQRDEPDLTQVLFWGKIQGTDDSYLICVGLQDRFSGVPAKKFYYL